ncbi:MAG: intermembrane phospholipid transport protein YdbH family protein [Desulfovibrio sp.]
MSNTQDLQDTSEHSPQKSKWLSLLLYSLVVITGIFVIGSAALSSFLPSYLKNNLPELVNTNQDYIELKQFDVAHAGLFSIRLENITTSSQYNVSIDRIEATYSPFKLLNKHINSLTIIGLRGTIPVFSQSEKTTASKTNDNLDKVHNADIITQTVDNLPVSIGTILIADSELTLSMPNANQPLTLPFNIRTALPQNADQYDLSCRFYVADGRTEVKTTISLQDKTINGSLTSSQNNLQQLSTLTGPLPMNIQGLLSCSATVQTDFNFSKLNLTHGAIELKQFTAQKDTIQKLSIADLAVSVNATAAGYRFAAPTFQFTAPYSSGKMAFTSEVTFGKSIALHTKFQTNATATIGANILNANNMGNISIEQQGNGWHLLSQNTFSAQAQTDSGTIEVTEGKAKGAFTQTPEQTSFEFDIVTGPLYGRFEKTTLKGKKLQVNIANEGKELFPLNGEAKLSTLTVQEKSFSANAKEFVVTLSATSATNIQGEVKLTGANAKADKNTLSGIYASIPFKSDGETASINNAGRMSIKSIKNDKRTVGSFKAKIRQKNNEVSLTGALKSNLLNALTIPVSGTYNTTSGKAQGIATIDEYQFTPETDLATFAPALQDVFLTGSLNGMIEFSYDTVVSSSAYLRFADGVLNDPENDVQLENLAADIYMEDLLTRRSAPLQNIRFSTLNAKGIKLTSGEVLFQTTPSSVIVEGISFNWAGGEIQALPFVVADGIDEYELALYCSDVSITQLLKQLGFADAQGQGRVGGKIPLTFKNGQLSFHKAQLYSSPDAGGIIQIKQAETLLSGVPKTAPEYVQLKIASEALKDFEYKWARITANTNGEELKVQLQLDGSPADTLPFEYNKDLGLVEMQAGSPGVRFQGIRMDVNFNLPFNRMLRLRNIFDNAQ